ncbi:tol-pal system protein YbgF [Pseudocolwellia agarivorans]|mgnify:CR=1 FL=1|uniref:tol-pal system protein YbgF n=1 Tax=Pseudocolwellia agarivorans TaxID=1911682 RepID=UPI000984AC85|nr:tol-pal system protein YbgF [Pseudocolwellia agarivorans]
MKLNKVLFGMILSVSTSCVLAAEPAPVVDISQHSSSNSSSKSISERIDSLEQKMDARNKAQVNVQRQLDDLQNELNELRGVTELHTHQLSQVLERQRELYQELDRRVSQALTTPAPVATPTYNASNVNDVVYSSDVPENEAYDRAVNLVLKERRYEEAIPEFKAFNLKFPNSAYAANAHYWLGQLLFNKNDLAAAKTEFEIVYNQFQDSPKRSDSILKLSIVEEKLNNMTRAKNLLKELIAKYPTSSAAKLAKPRLANLP